jgi:hypothetical protein
VPCNGLFRIGIESTTPQHSVGWIAYYGAKYTGRKEARHTPRVGLHNVDLVPQAIVYHILVGNCSKGRLEFHANHTAVRKAPR